MKIEIHHGRVVDPKHRLDRVTSVYLAEGLVGAMGQAPSGWHADRVLDGGTVLIYFAGNGANIDGKDYLAGVDTTSTADPSKMTPDEEVLLLHVME